MKFTQKKCSIRLPNTKSANALFIRGNRQPTTLWQNPHAIFLSKHHNPFTSPIHPSVQPALRQSNGRKGVTTYRSWLTLWNSALFCGLHWILKLAVSTNCPTVALKPDRNALNGYHQRNIPVSQRSHSITAIPFPDALPPSHEAFQAPSCSPSSTKGGNSHNSPPQPHTQIAIPLPRPGTP